MEIILIAALTLVASMVGALAGFGLSTIMIPALMFILPFPVVLLLVGIIHWFGNLWKAILFRKGIHLRLALLIGVPAVFASAIGASLVFHVSDAMLSRVLGGFLLAYVLFFIIDNKFVLPKHAITAMSGGVLSGFAGGIFGISGAVGSMFLEAFNLKKTTYIATSGIVSLLIDTSRIPIYFSNGIALPKDLWLWLIVFILASLLGVQLAKLFVKKIPQKYFRYVVLLFLLAAGIKLLFFPM